ncbi:hypothetical protein H8A99_31410 [Bradyrhizobium sp. Arg68]|uniref:hypothetical protein n=1 Tax=Bradyrhizobium ivorense TaxID=2511166 RepID=UPI001E5BBE79|nr:hypothetical protein [Bradyrhizobium ivorense]MCC8940829.1 hypothetical protein [Bradyrhizobium ivorense]
MTDELVVSYDRDSRRATLEYGGASGVWPRIRRACQDKSDQCEIVSSSSLRLPWWTFLAARADLEFLAQRYGFSIRAGVGAENKLAEPEVVDLDSDDFNSEDLNDFLGHVNAEMEDA